jgi:hypothetical protein
MSDRWFDNENAISTHRDGRRVRQPLINKR